MSNSILSRVARLSKRSFHSICFRLKSPSSARVEALNPNRIILGRRVRFGYFTRVLANDAVKSSIVAEDDVWTGRNVEIQAWSNQTVFLGQRVTLQDSCKVLGDVSIGAYATLAPNVYISSRNHQFAALPSLPIKRQDAESPSASLPVAIGEDAWLGINVVVMPGLSIGRGAIVGANSVVTKSIEPYAIYAGTPAKKIGQRLDYVPKAALDAKAALDLIYFDRGFDHLEKSVYGMKINGLLGTIAMKTDHKSSRIRFVFHSLGKNEFEIDIVLNGDRSRYRVLSGRNTIEIEQLLSGNVMIEIHRLIKNTGDLYVDSITIQ